MTSSIKKSSSTTTTQLLRPHIEPADSAGNKWTPANYFRKKLTIDPIELTDCTDFTDTTGHADEVQIRYLANLGLIAGNPNGSFSPDSTLTRAEASALFEKANGYDGRRTLFYTIDDRWRVARHGKNQIRQREIVVDRTANCHNRGKVPIAGAIGRLRICSEKMLLFYGAGVEARRTCEGIIQL